MPPNRCFIVTCEICGDRTSRINNEKRKFMAKFPLDEARCRQWIKVVGKKDLIHVPIEKLHTLKFLCGNHFESRDFNKKKNRLKKSAVPSKNLKADPLPDEMLLEFPYHIYSNIETTMVSQGLRDNETSLSQVEAITGPINSEPSTSGQHQLVDHDYCTRKEAAKEQDLQLHKKTILPRSEPSTSGQHQLLRHDFCPKKEKVLQSHKRKKTSGSDLEVTPRKRKLIKKLHLCQRKIISLRQENIMPRIKSLALKTLIKAYIRNQGRKPSGKRWTSLEKALAIAIYKKSPRTYRHLQHLIALPSIRSLQTLLQSIELEPGISPTIMDHLKKKAAKLNEKGRLCALLFDEIALKKRLIFNPRTDKVEGFVDLGENQYRSSEIANHALVFMLQGLHKKLKQPIAYYFVKGTISSQSLAILIKDVIKAVSDIGYTVITTVCDQGPTNIGSLNLLKEWCGIPSELNYFMLDIVKIFVIFDIPHLFKSLRNNFHNGGEIVIEGKKGKWSHLIDVAEKNKSTLHFKKFTALHVNPTFRSKMKVKLAAQVLSNTVAAILKLMAEKYGDDEKAHEILETAQIVEDLDRLFDCTNGPASRKDVIRHRRENVSKKSSHVKLWTQYKKKISTMYFLKADSFLRLKNVRCVQGYITTLTSLEDIWKYVESKGFKYLNLRQLNQDSLENLFGMIRQHCPTNRNPTCHHFTAALKSNILTKLSTPVVRGANCEEDDNEAIIDFEDFFQHVGSTEKVQFKKQSPENLLGEKAQFPNVLLPEDDEAPVLHLPDDYEYPALYVPDDDAEYLQMENSLFESFEKQPTVYVAGYLASVVLKKIQWQCENCKLSLKIEAPELCDTPMYSYIKLREWWQDKKSLTYPTVNLCKLVDTVTSCFDTQVKSILHVRHISQQTVTMMLTKCDNLLWMCSDHKDRLLHILLVRLSHLLIRNECHLINLSFAEAEESTADINKKAQQQGIAK